MDVSVEITEFLIVSPLPPCFSPQDQRVQELRQTGSVAEKLVHAKELKDEGNQLLTAARPMGSDGLMAAAMGKKGFHRFGGSSKDDWDGYLDSCFASNTLFFIGFPRNCAEGFHGLFEFEWTREGDALR